MYSLSSAELLAVWECALGRSALEQALLVLSGCLRQPPEQVARLSIGRRDRHLLHARAALFGRQLSALAACLRCGAQLEFRIDAEELCRAPSAEDAEELRVCEDGYEVSFRLPTTLDLAELQPEKGRTDNRAHLLERCLLSARHGDGSVMARDLPEAIVAAISRRMAEADPVADLQIGLTCPECGHHWDAGLDIGSFFWRELDAWAQRTLTEIHLLASAYGWSEDDILRLAPTRRQFYLNLITG